MIRTIRMKIEQKDISKLNNNVSNNIKDNRKKNII